MFEKIAIQLFGETVSQYLGYFETLKSSLKKADIDTTLLEYLCKTIFYAMLVFIISVLVTSVVITLLVPETIYSYTLGIIVSMLAAGGTFFFGLYYPNIVSRSHQVRIDRALPFTISHMATSAASGMSVVDIFKIVSMKEGAIGIEANKIYTNVKSLGMSPTDAMQRNASRSPSEQWSDLLYGMVSVIKAGGNMETYLKSRTRTFMSAYRRMLQEYASAVMFYTEIYITLVIVGSLFFIVLTAILSPMMGGGVILLQTFLVFFFIPMVSAGFIVLLKGISPDE